MRGARLLHMLLLLQNRGRMTSAMLARELEVSRRTILRDVDAMTEAGLPIVVHQGNQGGIELGFDYRTRLTGLAEDEALALGVILGSARPALRLLSLDVAGRRAVSKLWEAFPDKVRARMEEGAARYSIASDDPSDDPRVPAMALAVRNRNRVVICARSAARRVIHPIHLEIGAHQVRVTDQVEPDCPIALDHWGDLNISAKRFGDTPT